MVILVPLIESYQCISESSSISPGVVTGLLSKLDPSCRKKILSKRGNRFPCLKASMIGFRFRGIHPPDRILIFTTFSFRPSSFDFCCYRQVCLFYLTNLQLFKIYVSINTPFNFFSDFCIWTDTRGPHLLHL